MRKTIIPILLLGALALSACQFSLSSAPAVPTLSLAEVRATANAIAQAAIAQTMAAMPTPTATATPTPLPPTPNTALDPATPTQVLVPTAIATATVDPCNYTPLSKVRGPHVDVVITARLKNGTTQLRYFLRETPFGCGYGVITLSNNNTTTITIPQGCYDIYGMYRGPKKNDHFYTYACFEKKVGTYYALLYPEMIHFSTTP